MKTAQRGFPLSKQSIAAMKRCGLALGQVMFQVSFEIAEGMTSLDLDGFIDHAIENKGGHPVFKGMDGYAFASCISVNESIVHGMPNDTRFRQGDVVGVDIGMKLGNVCCDMAHTFVIGKGSTEVETLIKGTVEALDHGIAACRAGNTIGDVSMMINRIGSIYSCGIIEDMCGHGIGPELHMEPQIVNFYSPECEYNEWEIVVGTAYAIEPMFTLGGHEIEKADDRWTVCTKDKSIGVHFEHTVLVTKDGPLVLTDWQGRYKHDA